MNLSKTIVFVGAVLLFGCEPEKPAPATQIPMNWQEIDSLKNRLPEGIRVFAGQNAEMPLKAWLAEIDTKQPHIQTRVVLSADTADNRESTADFAARLNAPVAVNGGYFTMNKTPAGHVGLLAIDGNVIEPATRSVSRENVRFPTARAAIGFTENGKMDIAWVRTEDDGLLAWDDPLENTPETAAAEPDPESGNRWQMRDAIGAGPMLIEAGQKQVTSDAEVFFGTSIPLVHPRTAAGYSKDGKLFLLVVDGRQPESRGVSLDELAAMMQDLGAFEALNLDGGGSSTMIADGVLLNRPGGGEYQREVMSAIAVLVDQ